MPDKTFGNILHASRLGFEQYLSGQFRAWLRISPHSKGWFLEFRDDLPLKCHIEELHIRWWEGGTSQRLYCNSSFLMTLDASHNSQLPFDVVLDECGDLITLIDRREAVQA